VIEAQISYDASSEIHSVISGISRTEDLKLSPDNSRLAIVDFVCNKIFLFSVRIQVLDSSDVSPGIEILDYSVITSDSFQNPHGVAFLGNDNLIVCNRAADVCLFRIPTPGVYPRERKLKPYKTISGKGDLLAKVKTPGSVDCYQLDDNSYRVMVCNNHWHFISSHIIKPGKTARIINQGTLIQNALRIPDGVSISHDTDWIAISNHVDGEILIYKNTAELNSKTKAAAVLKGVVCPHGVRFSPDGKVLVADAASQYLHVYESDNGNWNGEQYPARSIRIMDDETFYNGRYDSREGGLKGIDIDNTGRVLVTTHRFGVLGFYDLKKLLSRQDTVDSMHMIELCRQRDMSLQRQQLNVLKREWTYKYRARQILRNLRVGVWRARKQMRIRLQMLDLYLRNKWSEESALDPSGPVVSMTSQCHRLELAFYALESIAAGSRKPSRMILWLTDEDSCSNPPETIERLKARGLEIHHSEELGPHTKYYPYIDRETDMVVPLVTADDDTLYPNDFIKQLTEAYKADTSTIHCFRAHRISMSCGRLMPYNSWTPCVDREPSHLNFITGVSGVIYPPEYLKYLKQQGKAFTQACPHGDDIWLSVNALRGGFKVAQIGRKQCLFPTIPKTQKRRLFDINVLSGLNQAQLRKTYSEADLMALHRFGAASELV
jgi:hypothetical protein